jgi:hypothetical protein
MMVAGLAGVVITSSGLSPFGVADGVTDGVSEGVGVAVEGGSVSVGVGVSETDGVKVGVGVGVAMGHTTLIWVDATTTLPSSSSARTTPAALVGTVSTTTEAEKLPVSPSATVRCPTIDAPLNRVTVTCAPGGGFPVKPVTPTGVMNRVSPFAGLVMLIDGACASAPATLNRNNRIAIIQNGSDRRAVIVSLLA